MHLAIIGSGPSSLYLIKHVLDALKAHWLEIDQVTVFEKSRLIGTGMPYSPATTDRFNLCNISSEELPALPEPYVDWLHRQRDADLARHYIKRDEIDSGGTYSRLAMGEYFADQYSFIIAQLRDLDVRVDQVSGTRVVDVRDLGDGGVEVVDAYQRTYCADQVVIATGHAFSEDDDAKNGYYSSPWPMQKLLPRDGEFFDFPVGILGASLSAFDVLTSIAHRHGTFDAGSSRKFMPLPGVENFKIVMYDSHGWLPHLQYEQQEPFRVVDRHVSLEALRELCDRDGFLRLDDYFDEVCRPALIGAFTKDGREDIAARLGDQEFDIAAFCDTMMEEHTYEDAFEGMRSELPRARRALKNGTPIYWKEVLDDLMYTLNFHAHLMPAEDHIRFRKVVMSFLMNVIAAMPLDSARVLLALHDAGRLELVAGRVEVVSHENGVTTIEVDDDGEVTAHKYRLFVSCGGQAPVTIETFPFASLVESGSVRESHARFSSANAAMKSVDSGDKNLISGDETRYRIGGIEIDEAFRVIRKDGKPSDRIFDIAFSHTTGVRPYFYGLQACDYAASQVARALCSRCELAISSNQK